MPTEERFVWYCEWLDVQADLIRRYTLTFYPRDNTIEMYDPKNHRPFLKRSEYAEVKLSDLYIGAVVTILARQLKIVEYADAFTKSKMESEKGRSLLLIKPDAYQQIGNILTAVHTAGFVVARLQMLRMGPQQAHTFMQMVSPQGSPNDLYSAEHLQSDVAVAVEVVGDRAIDKLKALVGPNSPREAAYASPRSIRALYGTDDVKNACHASEDQVSANAEVDFFFGPGMGWQTTALFNNCTLCIVRPHAFKTSGGEIVSRILNESYEISAMQLFYLDKATSEEFLEIYKGVLPEYHDMVSQLCAGPCLAMEVRQEDAVQSFRKLIGPGDPEVAKHLRPNTLRGKYGVDRVKNAIHCTDLPEDGLLEVEYFFNILYGRMR